jgi:hypothetical protein
MSTMLLKGNFPIFRFFEATLWIGSFREEGCSRVQNSVVNIELGSSDFDDDVGVRTAVEKSNGKDYQRS